MLFQFLNVYGLLQILWFPPNPEGLDEKFPEKISRYAEGPIFVIAGKKGTPYFFYVFVCLFVYFFILTIAVPCTIFPTAKESQLDEHWNVYIKFPNILANP